jgi:hypothetical protein
MKAIVLLGGAGVAVLAAFSGKAVAALQAKVAALEKRNSDLALKGRIVSSQLLGAKEVHGFGLDSFFAEPEFWQNTYDVGQVECSERCIAEKARATRRARPSTIPPSGRNAFMPPATAPPNATKGARRRSRRRSRNGQTAIAFPSRSRRT